MKTLKRKDSDLDQRSVVEIANLSFHYPKVGRTREQISQKPDLVLKGVNFQITTKGERIVVIGANGAGKSTFLRIIAGQHLVPDQDNQKLQVFGLDPFRDCRLNTLRTYVSADWGERSVAFSGCSLTHQSDVKVSEMMAKRQAEYPERRDRIMKLLRIDPNWRMHKVSDGQRRRVQLFLALIRPSKLIILDEVLAPLDIVSRQDLLSFLKEESEQRQVTIIFATHIFDGFDDWITHYVYVKKGAIETKGKIEDNPIYKNCLAKKLSSPLMRTVEALLRQEIVESEDIERELGKSWVEKSDAQISAGGYAAGRFCGVDLNELKQ